MPVAPRHLNPCMHEPCKGYTVFLRWHPFKEGWEIRRCDTCGKDTAQDSRR
jgi:hypothetical protein